MNKTDIQENLVGDTIPTTTRKKEKGVSKTIYFAKISCKEFEQYGVFGSKKICLSSVLKDSFSVDNENYNENEKCFSFSCDNQNYTISIIEHDEGYVFGKISTEKEYNDFLEEYRDGQNSEKLKSVIIKYFTFFYIDIEKKALIYIGQKGLKSINKLFSKYFETYGKEIVRITFLGNSDLIKKVERSTKLQSIEFQVADNGDVSKSLDEVLSWTRDINSFEIQIKIKKPSKSYIKQIISDNNRLTKIKNPVLKFQDESFNEYVSHLFDDYFTVKDVVFPSEIDINNFEAIRNRLVKAMNNYME